MEKLLDISLLNQQSFEDFNQTIAILFEPALPLAQALYSRRPFNDYQQLITVAAAIISHLSHHERLQVVNAHPRLGEKKLSALSAIEQAKMSEDDGIDEQLAMFNSSYERKHGFKFITFVNSRSRKDILPEIATRIANDTNVELQTGLDAMISIAFDRLKKITAKI